MVVVAIIGGTGSVGKTLVDAFKADGTHEVIVFARKVPEGGSAAPVFAVDYNNVEQLSKVLDEKNVHTVISTIMLWDEVAAQAEKNFIAAAAKSSSTKRFIATNWGNKMPEDESIRLPFNMLREQSLEALRQTNLEYSTIHNGLYLDYYGMPHVATHLTPLVFAIDIAHRTAAIPGAGDEPISFTYTKDMGKFVVAALSLPKWEPAMHFYSESTTLNQLVKVAEEMTGSKFKITYDSAEKLHRGDITELPSHPYAYEFFPKPLFTGFLSRFGLWAINGVMYVPEEGSLNEKFPEIKTATVRDIVGAWHNK